MDLDAEAVAPNVFNLQRKIIQNRKDWRIINKKGGRSQSLKTSKLKKSC